MTKQYIYVETTPAIKKKAIRMAKKNDMSLRQWVNKLIKEGKSLAPTDNGIPELDSICKQYNLGDININELVCTVWNKALVSK